MKWRLKIGGTWEPGTWGPDVAAHTLNAKDYAAIMSLPIGGRHVDADGDTWERIE